MDALTQIIHLPVCLIYHNPENEVSEPEIDRWSVELSCGARILPGMKGKPVSRLNSVIVHPSPLSPQAPFWAKMRPFH